MPIGRYDLKEGVRAYKLCVGIRCCPFSFWRISMWGLSAHNILGVTQMVWAFKTYILYLLNVPIVIHLKVNADSHMQYSDLCKCPSQLHWIRFYV